MTSLRWPSRVRDRRVGTKLHTSILAWRKRPASSTSDFFEENLFRPTHRQPCSPFSARGKTKVPRLTQPHLALPTESVREHIDRWRSPHPLPKILSTQWGRYRNCLVDCSAPMELMTDAARSTIVATSSRRLQRAAGRGPYPILSSRCPARAHRRYARPPRCLLIEVSMRDAPARQQSALCPAGPATVLPMRAQRPGNRAGGMQCQHGENLARARALAAGSARISSIPSPYFPSRSSRRFISCAPRPGAAGPPAE